MTNSAEMSICEICGGPAEIRNEGSTQGLFCEKCAWSVVTTCLPEILRDEILYDVTVISGEFKNEQHIKTTAKLTGTNFLAARKLLQTESSFVVFKGNASRVSSVRDVLNLACMTYEIQPSFPWQ